MSSRHDDYSPVAMLLAEVMILAQGLEGQGREGMRARSARVCDVDGGPVLTVAGYGWGYALRY